MNEHHRIIREFLKTMSPIRAEEYIKSFHLQDDEQLFLIEHDVKGKTYSQILEDHHASVEIINRRRQAAYSKIADHIKNIEPADSISTSILSAFDK